MLGCFWIETLENTAMTFTLPALPYAYDSLAPYMSAETLEFHHDKHHNAYVTNGNKLLQDTNLEGKPLEEIVKLSWERGLTALFNNVAQHWNHKEFWTWMTPRSTAIPSNLHNALVENFGSIETFKQEFINTGVAQFGSGWVWLTLNKHNKLVITRTANGENPLIDGDEVLLGCDVWEHAYYIDYRNARPKYLHAFIHSLVNWEYVSDRFENTRKKH